MLLRNSFTPHLSWLAHRSSVQCCRKCAGQEALSSGSALTRAGNPARGALQTQSCLCAPGTCWQDDLPWLDAWSFLTVEGSGHIIFCLSRQKKERETHSCTHLCVYRGKEKAVRVDRMPFTHIITTIQVWFKPRSNPSAPAGCPAQTDTQLAPVLFCLELPERRRL